MPETAWRRGASLARKRQARSSLAKLFIQCQLEPLDHIRLQASEVVLLTKVDRQIVELGS